LLKEGYLYILDQKYFNALFAFTDALALDKNNINARLWLAYTHTRLGNLSAAKAEYQKVLELDPYNSNALQALKILK